MLEYINIVIEFFEDNFGFFRKFGIVKVRRGEYSGLEYGLYLIKYEKCLFVDIVILRVKGRLGENSYYFLENNCEYFVMWCKIGILLF